MSQKSSKLSKQIKVDLDNASLYSLSLMSFSVGLSESPALQGVRIRRLETDCVCAITCSPGQRLNNGAM